MIPETVMASTSCRLLLAAALILLILPENVPAQRLSGGGDGVQVQIREAYMALRGPAEGRQQGEELLQEVLSAHPAHSRARELDVWRRYRFGGSFMPIVRHELRERAAMRLVNEDSSSAGAHLVLGLLEMDLFRPAHNRVQLPAGLAEGNRIDAWLGFVDVAIERAGDDTFVSLFDGEILGDRARLVRDDDVANAHADKAREHLSLALKDPFWAGEAAESLVELALRTRDDELLVEVARGLGAHDAFERQAAEYWTLHHIMRGEADAALNSYTTAVEAMDPARRAQVEDLTVLAAPGQTSVDSTREDWLDKDPLWMTDGNERAAEHLARVVAVERLFGRFDDPYQALSSDPGQLVLRYGIPSETVQFSSDTDGFLLLNYPDQYYLFHDMAKAGKWIFYSSSAAALTGPRSVAPQWERDFTLRAREAFEERPEVGRVPRRVKNGMDAAWYVFPHGRAAADGGQMVVVAAWCLPEEFTHENIDMGLYAVADGSENIRHLSEWSADGTGTGKTCNAEMKRAEVSSGSWRFSLEALGKSSYAVSRRDVKAQLISSIVPARIIVDREQGMPVPDGFFEQGDVWIEPLLPATVRVDEPVSVYAEVTGIPMDATSIRIETVLRAQREEEGRRWFRRGRDEAVSVRFEQDVSGSRAAIRVVLDMSNVAPGAYDLVVRVTSGSDDSYATENLTTVIVDEDADG